MWSNNAARLCISWVRVHNFGYAKRFHYERARAALGGVIAVLAADAARY
jgi:hypothetical protein